MIKKAEMAELARCPATHWSILVTLNGTDEVFFAFLFMCSFSLGRIIALQSLVRWGSCGYQHFPFRPGLPSAHCQHQDEWALMQHQGGRERERASGHGPTTSTKKKTRGSGKHAGKQRAALSLDLYHCPWCIFETRKHEFYLGFTFHSLAPFIWELLCSIWVIWAQVLCSKASSSTWRGWREFHIYSLCADFFTLSCSFHLTTSLAQSNNNNNKKSFSHALASCMAKLCVFVKIIAPR